MKLVSDKNNVENCEKVEKREKTRIENSGKNKKTLRMSHKRNFSKIKD